MDVVLRNSPLSLSVINIGYCIRFIGAQSEGANNEEVLDSLHMELTVDNIQCISWSLYYFVLWLYFF